MIRTRIAAAVVALALAPAARAQSPEAAAAAARSAFDFSILSPRPEFHRTMTATWRSMAQAQGGINGFFLASASVVAEVPAGAAVAAPAAEVELAGLLNRNQRTSLQYSVGGKTMWVGGAFDRQQNAYVSILVDGEPARFYNVRNLLDHEQNLSIGTVAYKLYLAPNVINQMRSEVVLENAANEDDKIRITLRRMMDAAGQAGQAVTLGTQAYRVFYTDDVRNGQADASAKVFTFLLVDGRGEIHVFIIPAELVPADRIAVFKMFEDKRVGLQSAGGRLKIFENP